LRAGELVGALGGLGLLVALFLPWYSLEGKHTADVTAWQAFSVTDIVLAAAAATALSVAICVLFRISVSYPVAGSSVATCVGFVAVILIVIRMIDPPGSSDPRLEFGLWSPSLEVGLWLGLASAIAITVGGYMGMQPLKAPTASAA
jgi:hypothetical protein